MSEGVCERLHENGSTEHSAVARHFWVLNSVAVSVTKTRGKLQQACEVDAISRAFRWHNMFSEGRTLVEDGQRSGRPSETRTGDNTARVRELVRSDRRFTVRMIAGQVNINRETVRLLLTEGLRMRKICAKMVPRNLTEQR
jgi:hypothetical protein